MPHDCYLLCMDRSYNSFGVIIYGHRYPEKKKNWPHYNKTDTAVVKIQNMTTNSAKGVFRVPNDVNVKPIEYFVF